MTSPFRMPRFLALVVVLAVAVTLGVAPRAGRGQADGGGYVLVPMDLGQADHLRAYGVAFWCLQQGYKVEWLLTYRGGAFLAPDNKLLEVQARLLGVSTEIIGNDTR